MFAIKLTVLPTTKRYIDYPETYAIKYAVPGGYTLGPGKPGDLIRLHDTKEKADIDLWLPAPRYAIYQGLNPDASTFSYLNWLGYQPKIVEVPDTFKVIPWLRGQISSEQVEERKRILKDRISSLNMQRAEIDRVLEETQKQLNSLNNLCSH